MRIKWSKERMSTETAWIVLACILGLIAGLLVGRFLFGMNI